MDLGDGPKRISVYGRTRPAALAAAKDAQRRADTGAPVRDSRQTLATWIDEWVRDVLPHTGRRTSTVDTYGTLARVHIRPRLGDTRLRDLRPSHVQRMLSEVGQVRAASTTRQVYAVLRACLDDAVKDGLLASNPCARVARPKGTRTEIRVLQPADVHAVLTAAADHAWYPVVLTIATTGLRRGEALALRWSDVDLDGAVLHVTGTLGRTTAGLVRGEPKTGRGWRDVPMTPELVAALRTVRTGQAEDRLRMGADWAPGDWVFTTAIGTPLEPRNVSRWYGEVATSAGLSDNGLHALRHAAASMMLAHGTPVRAVADVLGHSDVSVTLNTYTHALDGQTVAAVEGVAAMIRAAGE